MNSINPIGKRNQGYQAGTGQKSSIGYTPSNSTNAANGTKFIDWLLKPASRVADPLYVPVATDKDTTLFFSARDKVLRDPNEVCALYEKPERLSPISALDLRT